MGIGAYTVSKPREKTGEKSPANTQPFFDAEWNLGWFNGFLGGGIVLNALQKVC